MPYYGPRKVQCPKCKKTHTIMYGDLYIPDDPAFICKTCKPSLIDVLIDWVFGKPDQK